VNREAISAIGQLVGALAVVISLIYLANQVRGNARETRLAAMRSTLDFLNRFTQQIAEHADLAELRNRGFDNFESLEGVDRTRFGSYMACDISNHRACVLSKPGGACGSTRVAWARIGRARYERISRSSGLVALALDYFDEEFAKFIN
jgi:hypothetical protein